MTTPFRPMLHHIEVQRDLMRFRTNEDLIEAWRRNAATRLSDIVLHHRTIEIRRFMQQWGTILATELNVVELRTYVEVYAGGCRNFRRGGMTPRPSQPPMPDRCAKKLDLSACSTTCPGYEPMNAPTVEKHLEAIKDFYDYLVELGLLPFNFLEQVKKSWKKKNRHRMGRKSKKRHLTREEVLALVNGTPHWDRKITYSIGCKTGPRASEIGRLRVDPPWIDPDLTWLRIPPAGGNNGKRKGNDYLVVDNELRRLLVPYLQWRKQKLLRVHGNANAYPQLVIDQHGQPLPKGREAPSITEKIKDDAIRLKMMSPDAKGADAVTSHCLRRFFSNGCMDNGLYGTRLEILRGDKPKNRNEEAYGDFTDADIRAWYEEYAPVIGL
ncbi:MAG: hypothetical protein ACYC2H_04555 [Thermoplasmatota archaeon]